MLRGDVGVEVRDMVRRICHDRGIEIIHGHVRPDHVHILLQVPPKLSPSDVMQAIKGRTLHRLLQDYRKLRKQFWGRHLWARGYFVTTVGQVTEEAVKAYIENQDVQTQDDNFKVTE